MKDINSVLSLFCVVLKKISQTQNFLLLSLSNGFCKFLCCIVWFCLSIKFLVTCETRQVYFFSHQVNTSEVNKNNLSLYRVDLLAIYCPLVAKVRNCNSMLQFANPHTLFLRAVLHFLLFLCNVGVSPDQCLLFITEFKMFRDFFVFEFIGWFNCFAPCRLCRSLSKGETKRKIM